MDMERRYFSADDLEVRGDGDGPFVAAGHAATFNEPYRVADFQEQIDPRAFDGILDDPDIMALWNHNDDMPLGRTGAGTLEVSTDKRGLVSKITFPTSATREREAIERGDVRKMSFGFRVAKGGDEWSVRDDGTELRTIRKFEQLFDVSPVAFPANPKTDLKIDQRSRTEWRESRTDGESAHEHRRRELDLAGALW